ncbi:hypothetical protein [Candidatus Korobacter versatilis]|nr:hypothetical protein [Candidatus Koribacter versatilis]
MLRNSLLTALAVCPMLSSVFAQTVQAKPDDDKQVSIGGCLTARTKNGGYVLSNIFSPPITVVGPSYLATGMGHHVMLKGTWQSSGIAPEKNSDSLPKLFIASEVKVDSRQCAAPPLPPQTTATKPAKSSGGN